ncbi:hypothetical protein F1880_007891 [Penicillium rolfsii]|nr:hypothetical protein F1880_007891 [Penicillium rolfsii]
MSICKKAGVGDEFTSITECEMAPHVHLCIIDLIEAWGTDSALTHSSNGQELPNDSLSSGKFYYPREAAKKDPILRVLLKQLP